MSTYRKELKRYCTHCEKNTNSSNRKVVKLAKYPKYFYICIECGNPYAYEDYQELVMYLNRKNKRGRKTARISNGFRQKNKKQEINHTKRAGLCAGTYKLYLQTNHWQEIRLRKLKRNPMCQVCRKNEATQVHHLNYKDSNGETILYREKLSDLLSVCDKCHKNIHHIS